MSDDLRIPTKTEAHSAHHHRNNDRCVGTQCAFHLTWDRGDYALLADYGIYIQEHPACLVKKDYRRRPEDRWKQAGGRDWKGK